MNYPQEDHGPSKRALTVIPLPKPVPMQMPVSVPMAMSMQKPIPCLDFSFSFFLQRIIMDPHQIPLGPSSAHASLHQQDQCTSAQ